MKNWNRTHLLPNSFLMHIHIWTHNTTSIIFVGCQFGQDAHLFWSFSNPSFVYPSCALVRHPPLLLSSLLLSSIHVLLFRRTSKGRLQFKSRYSQMGESENMSKPSRGATAWQLGQKHSQQLLWHHTTAKSLFLQVTKVEVYPVFLTESMSQKIEYTYWRGACTQQNVLQQFSKKLQDKPEETGFSLNRNWFLTQQKKLVFHSLIYKDSEATERDAKN